MGTINKEWHLSNKMPDYLKKYKGEMKQEEIKSLWRQRHAKNCTCR
jgi:hypothetical protein